MRHFAVLITLLRDRPSFLEEIRQNTRVESKSISLLVASSVFFAIYGAIIGSSSGWLQVVSSAIKLPALYLITLTICLPTLYFFDILFGSALTFSQYMAMSLTSVGVISVLLFSFAPITLFFLISIRDYAFFLLLNVAIFALTGIVGIRLFHQGMLQVTRPRDLKAIATLGIEAAPVKELSGAIAEQEKRAFAGEIAYADEIEYAAGSPDFKPLMAATTAKQPSLDDLEKTRRKLLKFWLILYGLVGSQLGWTLRPFFGAPGEPFQIFRNIEGNFYSQVWRTLLTFLGFN